MTTETNPNYAANRAWSIAESMVSSMRKYLVAPTHPDDQGNDFQDLIEQSDAILAALKEVRGLLIQNEFATPDSRVLDAIDQSIALEVDVVVSTEIKKISNPEIKKFDLVGLLSIARTGGAK